MLIAMTGASGFIGRHIARELHERGHRVRALVRSSSDVGHLRAQGAELVVGDIDVEDRLRSLVKGADAVVHAAMYHQQEAEAPSLTFRETYLRKNLGGGSLLLEFAAQADVERFLLISSLEVYGSTLDPPFPPRDEATPLTPDSLYGTVKYALENAGLTYAGDLDFQVLRPGWIFGDQHPRGRNCFHPIVDRLQDGVEIPVELGAYMMWVEDLSRLAARLVENPPREHRLYNAHAGFVDWLRVSEMGKELLGSAAEITGKPAPPSPRPIIADRIKALGVPFRTDEGIRRTLEHIARLPRG